MASHRGKDIFNKRLIFRIYKHFLQISFLKKDIADIASNKKWTKDVNGIS